MGRAFKNFFISYAKAINKVYDRSGSLFQSKFKKKEIDSETYFSMIIAYVHLNPVRAGLVESAEEWPWSSYRTVLSHQPTLLKRDEVIQWYGGLEAFVDFHSAFDKESYTRKLLT